MHNILNTFSDISVDPSAPVRKRKPQMIQLDHTPIELHYVYRMKNINLIVVKSLVEFVSPIYNNSIILLPLLAWKWKRTQ